MQRTKFYHQYTKIPPTSKISNAKILTHSYSELSSITAHCTINVKPNIIFFYSQRSLFLFLFFKNFIFLFYLLSPLSLSSSLFPVTSISLYFMVWAPPLQGSLARNFKAQTPLDTKSTSPSECCRRYRGRTWQWGDLILWV